MVLLWCVTICSCYGLALKRTVDAVRGLLASYVHSSRRSTKSSSALLRHMQHRLIWSQLLLVSPRLLHFEDELGELTSRLRPCRFSKMIAALKKRFPESENAQGDLESTPSGSVRTSEETVIVDGDALNVPTAIDDPMEAIFIGKGHHRTAPLVPSLH